MILVRISADRSRKTLERVSIVEKLLAAISNFAHIAEGGYRCCGLRVTGCVRKRILTRNAQRDNIIKLSILKLEMTRNLRNDSNRTFERHVVLVSPEIHWNTGNIGRTCVATGSFLHLIQPLGFSLESKEVRRAGLDYWEQVKLSVWQNFDHFHSELKPAKDEVVIFSKNGARPFWEMPSPPRQFLIFGSETRGLPPNILNRYPDAAYHIPITKDIRSLNLSTAAGIALYESLRSMPHFHEWTV